jgi:hypothetical protein
VLLWRKSKSDGARWSGHADMQLCQVLPSRRISFRLFFGAVVAALVMMLMFAIQGCISKAFENGFQNGELRLRP